MKDFIRHKECRLCKSKKIVLVSSLQPTPIGDDYLKKVNLKKKKFPILLNKCQDCGFVQLSVTVDPNKVYGKYLYETKTSVGLPEHFFNLIEKLKKQKIIFKNCKVLEIGCNDGTLLNFLKKKGCQVLGVDPAVNIIKKLKFKIIKGLYNYNLSEKINKNHGKFDLVIANNVVANINNLDDLFDGVANNLTLNGFFVLETFSLYGILKNNLLDNIYHEHISYISIEPIYKFAEKKGLNIFFVENLKVKGGSLRFVFTKKNISKKIERKTKSLMDREKKLTSKSSAFKNFNKFNNTNNEKIFNYLKAQTAKGKKIYGFGASVGTTTNIYNLKIQKFVKGIFDHEKLRHNLFLPGTNIRVLSPKKLKVLKPDILIIFAWRYSKIILAKTDIPKYCKILVPLAKLKIF